MRALELYEVAHVHAERARYAKEQVDAHVGSTCFYLPEMRLVGARHQGKFSLREALRLPQRPDARAERFPMSAFAGDHADKGMC